VSKVVLDASALLALLSQERGAQRLTPELLSDAVASTVNLAEVQAKLVHEGEDPDMAWKVILASGPNAEPFTSDQAKTAGALVKQTRPLRLSLGDRACLALAMTLGAPVYTTDRNWKHLKLGIEINLLR
jgi:PIN domain nuclease of toxin-antitoxin system